MVFTTHFLWKNRVPTRKSPDLPGRCVVPLRPSGWISDPRMPPWMSRRIPRVPRADGRGRLWWGQQVLGDQKSWEK